MRGYYQAGPHRFRGVVKSGDTFLIQHPPPELRSHSHWNCFQYRDNGWYEVHFSRRPGNPSDGIMAIERILAEALGHAAAQPKPDESLEPVRQPVAELQEVRHAPVLRPVPVRRPVVETPEPVGARPQTIDGVRWWQIVLVIAALFVFICLLL